MIKPLAHAEFITLFLMRDDVMRLGVTREEALEALVVYLLTHPGQFVGDAHDEDRIYCTVIGVRDRNKMMQEELHREFGHLLFETTEEA